MSTDTRARILDGALDVLRRGDAVTLESAAHEVGVTKPGLMYHFPTKSALMLGVVDHVIERWESALIAELATPLADASPAARLRAYVDFSHTGEFDEADIVMFGDKRLSGTMTQRWTERMRPWLELPDDLAEPERGNLTAARLIADGGWLAAATGVFALTATERDRVRSIAYDLLGVTS